MHRYGSLISEVLELIAADPSLAEPLPGVDDYLRVEAVYAASHEGARHLDDVLARRTRASIEGWDRGVTAAPLVAALMAQVLGWDDVQEKNEVEHYLDRVGRRAQVADAAGRRDGRRGTAGGRRHRARTDPGVAAKSAARQGLFMRIAGK